MRGEGRERGGSLRGGGEAPVEEVMMIEGSGVELDWSSRMDLGLSRGV